MKKIKCKLIAWSLTSTFLAATADATTIFTSEFNGNIREYPASGGSSLFYSYVPFAGASSQISFGPDGDLYAILGDTSIVSFNQAGVPTTVLNSFPSPISGFAFDGNSDIFTSDFNGNIFKYPTSGGSSLFYSYVPFAGASSQISFGPNGKLYAILGDTSIVSFDPAGVPTVALNNFPSPISGFAFDGDSNIFTSDFNGNIYKYPASGGSSLFYSYVPFAGASSQISFGPDGDLYAILGDTSIVSFNQAGVPTTVLNSFPSPISGFAFDPVPEPTTHIIMLIFVSLCLSRHTRGASTNVGKFEPSLTNDSQ